MPKFIILEKITKTVSGCRYIGVEAESAEEAFRRWNEQGDEESDEIREVPVGFEVVLDETELDNIDTEFEYIKLDGHPETTMSYGAIHNLAYPDASDEFEQMFFSAPVQLSANDAERAS